MEYLSTIKSFQRMPVKASSGSSDVKVPTNDKAGRLDNRADNRYYDTNPYPAPEKQIARVYI